MKTKKNTKKLANFQLELAASKISDAKIRQVIGGAIPWLDAP